MGKCSSSSSSMQEGSGDTFMGPCSGHARPRFKWGCLHRLDRTLQQKPWVVLVLHVPSYRLCTRKCTFQGCLTSVAADPDRAHRRGARAGDCCECLALWATTLALTPHLRHRQSIDSTPNYHIAQLYLSPITDGNVPWRAHRAIRQPQSQMHIPMTRMRRKSSISHRG